MENAILTERIGQVERAARRAGLPPLRTDLEDGGAVLLLSRDPHYVEVQIDQDGLARAVARDPDQEEPACCGLAPTTIQARLAMLAEFVRSGTFPLDLQPA